MRTIGVVTVARSDLGHYLPVFEAIRAQGDLRLRVIATGMHLSPEFGMTVRQIQEAGFEVEERVESLVASDTPEGVAKSMGLGVLGFAQMFGRHRPDILLVLGDRFDMLPAALAALPFNIPVAHISGGESTEGLIDEAIRHSLTKLSHLHFVSTDAYAQRVIQMGEEPWRVTVSGSPSVDRIRRTALLECHEVALRFGLNLERPSALVTYHPVSLEWQQTDHQVERLLAALNLSGLQCVFTFPNADTNGRIVIERIKAYCATHPDSHVVVNTGNREYLSLMNTVSVMVGNSSSGIIEAASFRLPVVDIGNRQRGRIRSRNVVHCAPEVEEITSAIRRAISPEFRVMLGDLQNPYGDGYAAERIVERLAGVRLDSVLLEKRFHVVGDKLEA